VTDQIIRHSLAGSLEINGSRFSEKIIRMSRGMPTVKVDSITF
jgi:hypothetical protein